ncbi:hypothetical protein [Novosphingobium cyanobacteriorum]|uniref:Uncharacterized protein n=1 Tax=Novosphingobium cyanobacteriorum TaxID=3024215 RepID=A0ABT6CEI5_9SPHN|nr:hypothetical protein [Novosphingobium cyanobacteriorum]MDF8332331.1 hypothetical protein [Novosphingobium cyanobacteriorum]
MVRFAPRYGRISPCLVQPPQVRYGLAKRRAANDNVVARRPGHWASDDATLAAALRYFAEHGFAAAERAGQEAESARASGDLDKARHWMGVCRTLDRGVALRLQRGR